MWSSIACGQRRLGREELSKLIANRTLSFAGDSHIRNLHNYLASMFGGEWCVRVFLWFPCFATPNPQILLRPLHMTCAASYCLLRGELPLVLGGALLCRGHQLLLAVPSSKPRHMLCPYAGITVEKGDQPELHWQALEGLGCNLTFSWSPYIRDTKKLLRNW